MFEELETSVRPSLCVPLVMSIGFESDNGGIYFVGSNGLESMNSSNEYGASLKLSFFGGGISSCNPLGSNGDIISNGECSGISAALNGGGNGVVIGGNTMLLLFDASENSLDKLVFEVEAERSAGLGSASSLATIGTLNY